MKRYCLLTVSIFALTLVVVGLVASKLYAVTYSVLQPPVNQITGFASGAAQSNTATLTGVSGQYTYLEGFDLTGGGATGASIIEVTTTGMSTNPKFEVAIAAGVTAPASAPSVFTPALPSHEAAGALAFENSRVRRTDFWPAGCRGCRRCISVAGLLTFPA